MTATAPAVEMTWRSALLLMACAPALGSAVALVVRDVERRAGAYLALFVTASVIAATPQIIGFAGFFDVWPNLTFVPLSVEFFLPALLYLHADVLMTGRPLGRRWRLLIPGAVQLAYYTIAFVAFDDHHAKWAYSTSVHTPYVVPLEIVATLTMAVVALVATVRLLRRYRAELAATQSADELFDPIWISRFVAGLSVTTALWGAVQLWSLVIAPVSYAGAYPFNVTMMLIVSGLGLGALSRIRDPFPKLGAAAEQPDSTPGPGAQADDATPSRDWTEEGQRLREAVVAGLWYLEPRLSIRDVARRLTTNESYVSRAVNDGLGLSFKGLINALRVEHAKHALRETDAPILEVGLASGFNSKSTFNRVFREKTGVTPSMYRSQST